MKSIQVNSEANTKRNMMRLYGIIGCILVVVIPLKRHTRLAFVVNVG